ncbi:hypothetical protein RI054_23g98870 [Pseudoscourfieldia marina]
MLLKASKRWVQAQVSRVVTFVLDVVQLVEELVANDDARKRPRKDARRARQSERHDAMVGEAMAAFSKAHRKLVGVNNIMKESFFVDRFTELCTFTLPPSADAVDVHSAVSFAKEVVVTTTSRVSCENIGRYLPNKIKGIVRLQDV